MNVKFICKHPHLSDGKGRKRGALVGGTQAPEWGLTPGWLGKGRVYRESLMKAAALIRETYPEEGGGKPAPCDDIRRDFPGNFPSDF